MDARKERTMPETKPLTAKQEQDLREAMTNSKVAEDWRVQSEKIEEQMNKLADEGDALRADCAALREGLEELTKLARHLHPLMLTYSHSKRLHDLLTAPNPGQALLDELIELRRLKEASK